MNTLQTIPGRFLAASPGPGQGPARAAAVFAAAIILLSPGCQSSAPTAPGSTGEPSLSSATPTHASTPASKPEATRAPELAALPSPVRADQVQGTCPDSGNLLGDGGFAGDLEGWAARYGMLRHTSTTFVGEPGAALLVTSEASADGGNLAVAGRCLDLDPGAAGQTLTLEAYLLALPEIESVSFSVFFHAEPGCRGAILQVDGPPAVTPDSGWTYATLSLSVPSGAAAADFVVRAVSQSDTGRALLDGVCAYRASGPG